MNIWQDKWIPCPTFVAVQPPDCPYSKVADLIDASSKQWKTDLVRNLFPPPIATKILCIPISRDLGVDRLVWTPEKKGFFSVKSAYWIARTNVMAKVLTSTSEGDSFQPLWSSIWKAKVPGKVQICVWRACHDLLATRDRLLTKGYDGEVTCLLCPHPYEEVSHLFCKCPTAYNILTSAPFNLQNSLLPRINFKEWMLERALTMKQNIFEQLLMIIWSLWRNRNNKFWSGTQQTSIDVSLSSKAWLGEFQRARGPSKVTKQSKLKFWKPAMNGAFKLNVDAAFLADQNQGGTGGVLRDHSGKFVAAFASPIMHSASAKQSELRAILDGLDFLYSLQIHNVVIESDCTEAISEANARDSSLLANGALIEDIQTAMNRLQSTSIAYVPRDCNRVAHRLASIGFEATDSFTWFDQVPECIHDVMQHDCRHLN